MARVADHSAICTDHFFIKIFLGFSVVLSQQNFADHYPITCVRSINTDYDKLISQQYRYRKFDQYPIKIKAFLNSLDVGLSQRENELFLCDDPNEAFSNFNTEFISNFEKTSPLEKFLKQPELKHN